jgi:hypothetical protein
MTPKQKLKSIEKKMERLQFNNDRINFADIKKYYELEREHFFLKFQIEHCQTCGKKL